MSDGETMDARTGGSASPGGPTIRRDDVVDLFGTPDHTTGSVNEPRLQVEHRIEFNEKWVYDQPRREPTRPRARVIYWQRYDFVGCVRIEQDGRAVRETPADLLRRRGEGSHP
jgi:hypothetical protein